MSDTKFFAAFIMTYERSSVLKDTIIKVFSQTLPPEMILIVDNSETLTTLQLIESMADSRIKYHRVGYNAGPAGAAKIGLQLLAEDGYQWIYWGDDDNPPDFPDTFEKLLGLIATVPNVGIASAVGQYFSKHSGNIVRVPDFVLKSNSSVMVDSIAGGMTMLVNAEVVRSGVLPDAHLFFGFEELDFCIKTKKIGFNLVASTDLFLRSREKFNRLNFQRPFYMRKSVRDLHRQYYSVRNLIVILKRNRLIWALIYQITKTLGKSIYGFRYGFNYGKLNLKHSFKGLGHGLFGYRSPFLEVVK